VAALPAGSDVAVLGFGNEVSLVADLGSPIEDLAFAIDGLVATGDTALYDAVIVAAQALDRASRSRQFIVVLSDGGDTASAADLATVTDALEESEVGFFAIELQGSELDSAALNAMADAAAGRVVPAADASALSSVYEEIAAEVISQYAVSFEAIAGGSSLIEVVVGSGASATTYRAEIDLPRLRGSTPVVTLTVPPPRTVSPAPSRIIGGPSSLAEDWALNVGVALLAVTLLIVLAYALMPSTSAGRRSSLLAMPGERISRRRRRSRLLEGGNFEPEVFRPRVSRGIDASLEAAGVAMSATEYLFAVIGLALAGVAVSLLLGSVTLGLLLLVGAVVVPRLWLNRAAEKRRSAFADQLEGNLQLIAGSLRAGYGLTQAVATVAEESPSPSKEEFRRVVVETRLGRDLAESLRATAARMRNEDFGWVADAIAIQQEVGGNLAEVLDGVGGTIRDRNNIRRQVRALSAEGRVSAVILITLPFALALIVSVINPNYLDALFDTTAGRVMLGVGAILMTVGGVWIRRLIQVVF